MEITMYNKKFRKLWRLLNTILITVSMFLPWFMFYFDLVVPSPDISPPIGLVFLFSTLQLATIEFYENGFDFIILLVGLIGFSGIVTILYSIFNLIVLIKDKDTTNKKFSAVLIGIVVFLSILVLVGGKPLLGYWLVNVGLISSAILEWHSKEQVQE